MKTEALPGAERWMLATAALTLAPHARHLPLWLSAACALLLALRAVQLWRPGLPTLPRPLLVLLAGLLAWGIRGHFDHFFGREPGVAVLAGLLCLKLFEGRSARDLRVGVLLAFFLQLGLFFEDQSPLVGLLALCGTLTASCTLLALHQTQAGAAQLLRSASVLMIQGLPFMLVLFILFPRVQGPLWGLPADAHSARSGLSDSMSPGSISNLILSDEIAFRAEFDGPPPPPAQRYWRGPVLSEFDGRSWRASRSPTSDAPVYAAQGPQIAYQLTLEPHDQHWLLALDYPDAGLPGVRYAADFKLLLDRPLRSRMRFDLRARPSTPVGVNEQTTVLIAATRLPGQGNPRTRALAAELAAAGQGQAARIVEQTLARLRDGDYIYTLSPPLLDEDSVDGFLFDTREGFCEHFASSFVFLMRAAGVPARVVTGYQGGTLNPVDGVMVVRQSDAHAWAEVWLEGEGWRRIDPTAAAAPRRIEAGLGESLRAGDPRPLLMREGLSWLRHVRHQWEALSNHWNQWVLGYNPDRQRDLLGQLGLSATDWRSLGLVMGAAACVLIAGLLFWAMRQGRQGDALDHAWQSLCKKAARRGLLREPWEGPQDFARRLCAAFPARAAELDTIAREYARLRYRDPARQDEIKILAERIRRVPLP